MKVLKKKSKTAPPEKYNKHKQTKPLITTSKNNMYDLSLEPLVRGSNVSVISSSYM